MSMPLWAFFHGIAEPTIWGKFFAFFSKLTIAESPCFHHGIRLRVTSVDLWM